MLQLQSVTSSPEEKNNNIFLIGYAEEAIEIKVVIM